MIVKYKIKITNFKNLLKATSLKNDAVSREKCIEIEEKIHALEDEINIIEDDNLPN